MFDTHTHAANDTPPFDVFVTNPPFSGDHLGRVFDFLSSLVAQSKPWFVLVPDYVARKPFFWDLRTQLR